MSTKGRFWRVSLQARNYAVACLFFLSRIIWVFSSALKDAFDGVFFIVLVRCSTKRRPWWDSLQTVNVAFACFSSVSCSWCFQVGSFGFGRGLPLWVSGQTSPFCRHPSFHWLKNYIGFKWVTEQISCVSCSTTVRWPTSKESPPLVPKLHRLQRPWSSLSGFLYFRPLFWTLLARGPRARPRAHARR